MSLGLELRVNIFFPILYSYMSFSYIVLLYLYTKNVDLLSSFYCFTLVGKLKILFLQKVGKISRRISRTIHDKGMIA
jgi:hypothetical protein